MSSNKSQSGDGISPSGGSTPDLGATQNAQDLYTRLAEVSYDGVIVQADGRVAYVNEAACRMLRVASPDDLLGREIASIVDPAFRDAVLTRRHRAMTEGRTIRDPEIRHLRADGTSFPARMSTARIDWNGMPATLNIIVDVSREREAQDRLTRTSTLIRTMLDTIGQGFAIFDNEYRLVAWNAKSAELSKLPPDFLHVGMPVLELHRHFARQGLLGTGDPEELAQRRYRQSLTATDAVIDEMTFPDGSVIMNCRYPMGEAGQAVTQTDVTERRRSDTALRESERQYRQLIETLPDAALVSVGGAIVFANDAGIRMFGAATMDQLLGKTGIDLVHADEHARALDRRAQSETTEGALPRAQFRYRRVDGTEFLGESSASNCVWQGERARIILVRDVTERTRLEEQLRQSQKMETVGQLTGGVAHDFNNLLAIILGNLELSEELVAAMPDLADHVRRAIGAAERGAKLTQQLLAFSRQQPLQPRPVDARGLVGGLLDLLRRSLGESIDIEVVSDAGLWLCEADPAQMENAIMNLALNSRDAMPNGGKLTIECGNVRLDDEYAAAQSEVTPGRYVMIAVSDTGAGIAPEAKGYVFDPFFTTKEIGKGTGLGLSMVYGFVKQSNGHITVYSELGVGTTFKMYLPRIQAADGSVAAPTAEIGTTDARGETILVVEDDIDVRQLVVTILEALGYQVLEAGSATAAQEILKAHRVDLLLTDVVLPGEMDGAILARQAQKAMPGLKVLYMSGYTENAILHQGRLDDGVTLLQKPFRKADLARKVREALGA